MAATCECEIWLMLDSDGNYAVASSSDSLAERYEEDIGQCSDAGGLRRVKVSLTVPLPEVVELAGTVPEQGEPAELKAV